MRSNSTNHVQCLVEPLEGRRLYAVTVPDVTGHFNGGLFFDAGQNDIVDFRITYQQKSRFSGTFLQGDGSAGVLVGSVNKRGVATFTFQSTNLVSNFKGKAKAGLDGTGDSLTGDFIMRLGRRSAAGTFSVTRVSILDEKSG